MPDNRLEIENTREIIIEAENWNIAPFTDGEARVEIGRAHV